MNVFPSQIEEKLFQIEALSAHYQIFLGREGRLDTMEVRVEARQDAGAEARHAGAKQLAHMIKSTIGISTKISVCEPGSVERSGGKARRIVDQRPKG